MEWASQRTAVCMQWPHPALVVTGTSPTSVEEARPQYRQHAAQLQPQTHLHIQPQLWRLQQPQQCQQPHQRPVGPESPFLFPSLATGPHDASLCVGGISGTAADIVVNPGTAVNIAVSAADISAAFRPRCSSGLTGLIGALPLFPTATCPTTATASAATTCNPSFTPALPACPASLDGSSTGMGHSNDGCSLIWSSPLAPPAVELPLVAAAPGRVGGRHPLTSPVETRAVLSSLPVGSSWGLLQRPYDNADLVPTQARGGGAMTQGLQGMQGSRGYPLQEAAAVAPAAAGGGTLAAVAAAASAQCCDGRRSDNGGGGGGGGGSGSGGGGGGPMRTCPGGGFTAGAASSTVGCRGAGGRRGGMAAAVALGAPEPLAVVAATAAAAPTAVALAAPQGEQRSGRTVAAATADRKDVLRERNRLSKARGRLRQKATVAELRSQIAERDACILGLQELIAARSNHQNGRGMHQQQQQ